jgi:Uma2 family endonuclease
MTIATSRLPPPDLVYPETDGEPMAENTIQYRYITLIKGGIEVLFRQRDDVFVAADLFWYPVEGRPDIRTAPDTMVAFGRPKGDRRSYQQWLEDDVPPQVVFEVLSPGNRLADQIEKSLFYQRYGVREYYVYDPDSGELSGWQREEDELRPVPRMQGWVSPALGVRFELAGRELQLFGPDGRRFETYEELAAQRDQAEAERDTERHEKEQAVRERDELREQADRLAAQLRELERGKGG